MPVWEGLSSSAARQEGLTAMCRCIKYVLKPHVNSLHAVGKIARHLQGYILHVFTWNGSGDGTIWLGGMWACRAKQQGSVATVLQEHLFFKDSIEICTNAAGVHLERL